MMTGRTDDRVVKASRQEVFLLWHVHTFENGSQDDLLIGVFRTEQQARAVWERLREKRGFADQPEAFSIAMYEFDKVYWPEGYFVDPPDASPPNPSQPRTSETWKH